MVETTAARVPGKGYIVNVCEFPFGVEIQPSRHGPVVTRVLSSTRAAREGVCIGDVVTKVAGVPVTSQTWEKVFLRHNMPFSMSFLRPRAGLPRLNPNTNDAIQSIIERLWHIHDSIQLEIDISVVGSPSSSEGIASPPLTTRARPWSNPSSDPSSDPLLDPSSNPSSDLASNPSPYQQHHRSSSVPTKSRNVEHLVRFFRNQARMAKTPPPAPPRKRLALRNSPPADTKRRVTIGPTLREVLSTQALASYFRRHCVQCQASEGFNFLQAVESFQILRDYRAKLRAADRIFKEFIETKAPQSINIGSQTRADVIQKMRQKHVAPGLFSVCKREVFLMLKQDVFPRFCKGPLYTLMLQSMVQSAPKKGGSRRDRALSFSVVPMRDDPQSLSRILSQFQKSTYPRKKRSVLSAGRKDYFFGSDFVDWAVRNKETTGCVNRIAAVGLGLRLLDVHKIHASSSSVNCFQDSRASEYFFGPAKKVSRSKTYREVVTGMSKIIHQGFILLKRHITARYHKVWAVLTRQKFIFLYMSRRGGDLPLSVLRLRGATAWVERATTPKAVQMLSGSVTLEENSFGISYLHVQIKTRKKKEVNEARLCSDAMMRIFNAQSTLICEISADACCVSL